MVRDSWQHDDSEDDDDDNDDDDVDVGAAVAAVLLSHDPDNTIYYSCFDTINEHHYYSYLSLQGKTCVT